MQFYVDQNLKKKQKEVEDNNNMFEDVLSKENEQLLREIQEMEREIQRATQERENQKKKYTTEIRQKEETITCKPEK